MIGFIRARVIFCVRPGGVVGRLVLGASVALGPHVFDFALGGIVGALDLGDGGGGGALVIGLVLVLLKLIIDTPSPMCRW